MAENTDVKTLSYTLASAHERLHRHIASLTTVIDAPCLHDALHIH